MQWKNFQEQRQVFLPEPCTVCLRLSRLQLKQGSKSLQCLAFFFHSYFLLNCDYILQSADPNKALASCWENDSCQVAISFSERTSEWAKKALRRELAELNRIIWSISLCLSLFNGRRAAIKCSLLFLCFVVWCWQTEEDAWLEKNRTQANLCWGAGVGRLVKYLSPHPFPLILKT